jgi:hypothetical protein
VVPIQDNRRCWLTVEDVVRFFLGSVALFQEAEERT